MAAIAQLPADRGWDLRASMIAASTTAPEARRIEVKLAASIAVSRSAIRQSSELPANANMANRVSAATRGLIIRTLWRERRARHYRAQDMNRIKTLLLAALLLSGCGTFYPGEPMGPRPRFTAALNGTNEVPATTSPARGALVADYLPATKVMHWTLTLRELSGPVTWA